MESTKFLEKNSWDWRKIYLLECERKDRVGPPEKIVVCSRGIAALRCGQWLEMKNEPKVTRDPRLFILGNNEIVI